MTVLRNLKTSIGSLASQTNGLLSFLNKKQYMLIFSDLSIEDNFDYKAYSLLYDAIKAYNQQIPDANNKFLKEKLDELPAITDNEFKLYQFPSSSYLLFILIPVGLVVWTNKYLKLSALQHKMHGIVRTLGTTEFILKAMLN